MTGTMRRLSKVVKSSAWLVLLACTLLGSVACGGDEGPEGPPCYEDIQLPAEGGYVRAILEDGAERLIVLNDEKKTEIRVPRDPQRIVCTLPGITETVDYLGAFNRVVAVSRHCDRPAGVDMLPTVSVMPVNYEAITAVEPDLILVDDALSEADLAEMQKRLPGVLPLRSRSLADLQTSFDLLAQVLDTDVARERSIRFARALRDTLAYVAIPEGENPPRVLVVAQSKPLYVLGPGALLDDMLRACGAVNLACDLGRPSGPFAPELVRTRQPLWILTTGKPLSEALMVRWSDVPAVADERVVSANADDLLRAGPRTIQALRRLGDVLHERADPYTLSEEP